MCFCPCHCCKICKDPSVWFKIKRGPLTVRFPLIATGMHEQLITDLTLHAAHNSGYGHCLVMLVVTLASTTMSKTVKGGPILLLILM